MLILYDKCGTNYIFAKGILLSIPGCYVFQNLNSLNSLFK